MTDIILETERLCLESIGGHHRKNLYELLSNEVVHRYFPKTLNREESCEFYNTIQSRYKTDGYCYWAVMRKSDYRFLGSAESLNRQLTELLKQKSDTGWMIPSGIKGMVQKLQKDVQTMLKRV